MAESPPFIKVRFPVLHGSIYGRGIPVHFYVHSYYLKFAR